MKVKKSFSSHLTQAHALWRGHLQEGDWAIDATCGNGWDTLALSEMVGPTGKVIALDVQKEALRSAKEKTYHCEIEWHHRSHETFPPCKHPVSLIAYNLGYLPGGDKSVTTMLSSTLESVKKSLVTIGEGGLISITCYPGHAEGAREETALLKWAETLTPTEWEVRHYRWPNRDQSPSLLTLRN